MTNQYFCFKIHILLGPLQSVIPTSKIYTLKSMKNKLRVVLSVSKVIKTQHLITLYCNHWIKIRTTLYFFMLLFYLNNSVLDYYCLDIAA